MEFIANFSSLCDMGCCKNTASKEKAKTFSSPSSNPAKICNDIITVGYRATVSVIIFSFIRSQESFYLFDVYHLKNLSTISIKGCPSDFRVLYNKVINAILTIPSHYFWYKFAKFQLCSKNYENYRWIVTANKSNLLSSQNERTNVKNTAYHMIKRGLFINNHIPRKIWLLLCS